MRTHWSEWERKRERVVWGGREWSAPAVDVFCVRAGKKQANGTDAGPTVAPEGLIHQSAVRQESRDGGE